MSYEIPSSELAAYERWLDSSSISTPDSDEMRIAWVLARELHMSPTTTIKAARRQQGQQKHWARVEKAVAADPAISFQTDDRGVRRLRFVGRVVTT